MTEFSRRTTLSSLRLSGRFVYLRPPRLQDATEGPWFSWFNDPEATRFSRHGQNRNTREDQIKFFRALEGDDSRLVLAVCDQKSDDHIGVVSLQSIDRNKGRAEIAIMIGSALHRRGFNGLEAWAMITEYGFEQLGLQVIYAGSHVGLESWVRLVELLGYKETGREPYTLKSNEKPATLIHYECTAQNFRQLKKRRGPLSVMNWARHARRD